MARVYKFLPSKWALDAIKNQHIKIARICNLNDPFDLLPYYFTSSEHQKEIRHAREVADSEHGMVCFSFKWSNPVLWSHYAAKHTGICLGFDVPDEYARPVMYVDKRLPFPTESNETIALEWTFTKFSGWCYEDECRIVTRLDEEEDGNYFEKFEENQMVLREVVLGCKDQLDPTGVLESLLEPYDEEVNQSPDFR